MQYQSSIALKKYDLQWAKVLIFAFLLMHVMSVQAQKQDTASIANLKVTGEIKKAVIDTAVQKHSARKATIMSAACPGLGQIYNKKYWKLPIIYGGLGVTGYLFTTNTVKYVRYRNALRLRLDSDSTTNDTYTDVTNETLLSDQNRFHRSRDFMALIFCAVYALQIVDATVDAHLFYFDVSDDLSMHIFPSILNRTPTLGVSFTFKGTKKRYSPTSSRL